MASVTNNQCAAGYVPGAQPSGSYGDNITACCESSSSSSSDCEGAALCDSCGDCDLCDSGGFNDPAGGTPVQVQDSAGNCYYCRVCPPGCDTCASCGYCDDPPHQGATPIQVMKQGCPQYVVQLPDGSCGTNIPNVPVLYWCYEDPLNVCADSSSSSCPDFVAEDSLDIDESIKSILMDFL